MLILIKSQKQIKSKIYHNPDIEKSIWNLERKVNRFARGSGRQNTQHLKKCTFLKKKKNAVYQNTIS